ncbi:MFS transporter [Fluoribacter dumoffii]|uniref:Lysosomal dipeptide transporter MFSD1 n=1 Tax=Fluoribacter dumoffii TaxID=463 RepID=A0A377GC65_9GAMM|nr:MFS transporter [Fluoribacter dumoffii]KTC90710.1 major facilitator family transporter [Fluoribacter dumoffii NY 23]MCW8386390.1 MFS transporter [Fluoribacter dumoffii]MCW8419443.1 MFS transporter [Fluoribacter dumoffii]MCW8452682.1 MFS transporter [Fluoribacter dumoffii]MCW8460068.1 MFS transporter [Fluoribacter dumoffii]
MQVVDEFQEYNDLKSSLLPWMVCFAATLFFFYEFIQGNMFASIAADIMQAYQIQADKMAWLSSIYYLSNVLFLFVAGMVLDRFSIKNTLLIAMFLCVASTFLLAHSDSFYMALFCRFITGIGSAFCFLGPVRLASHWFPPRRMALVTGAIVTMAMAGGMLAQYPLTKLVLMVGWRQAVQDVGILGFVMLLVMFFWIKEKPKNPLKVVPPINVISAAKKAYFNAQYIRAAFYASLMNMAIAVFGAMMGTLYLVQRLDINSAQASMVNGMLFLGAIIGSPLVGWISDKMGLRIVPMKIGVIASLLTLLSVLYLPVSYSQMAFLFFLLGFFTSAQVISYALVAESSPPAMTATAVSVISILTQGGYIVYQNLFSYLLTNHGGMHMVNGTPVYLLSAYQYAAIILPIGLLIAFLMLFGLKETHCQHTED